MTLRIDPDLQIEAFDMKLDDDNAGLVGLHTCGDLGPSLIKIYSLSDKVSNLQSVGCCYMYIKETFPLSSDIDGTFNYTTLELACHAIGNFQFHYNFSRYSFFPDFQFFSIFNFFQF